MRHLKSGNKLGVPASHRRAMLRNLVTSLLEHGRITTTLARAKEMRGAVDRMIGLAKRGDLHARRQALGFVKTKLAMANLFGNLAERYKDRQGGYTRIIASGFRRGDGAQMALILLVGGENDPFKAKPARGKGRAKSEAKAAAPSGAREKKAEQDT
jgi:large subunit ribosomal protein L17